MSAARLPEARRAAVQHLLRLRANYGFDPNSKTPQHLVGAAESGCQVLAEQLYQKSTHFLLELVQNADDNTYQDDKPTLHFTYTKGYLRVDCNEVGFSPKDIDAICNLGRSSKAGAGVSTQFVGEKGIGFKSVFKVAEQVWVSSKQYEFKFDKKGKLGMIAPILEDFPAQKRDGWTSFILKLAPKSEGDLLKELRSSGDLSPELLLFLRRLHKLVLTIQDPNDGTLETKTYYREDADFAGKEAKHLYKDGEKLASYLFMRHKATNLPAEEKRDGVRESEVILAFPLDGNNEPLLEPQTIYAYLPIREYGFRFLIQADFLLIASREDVDNSSEWNKALRDACVNALDECVTWFNASAFKFVWPRYLPAKPGPSDFFCPLKKRMLRHLSRQAVLEDLNGNLQQPCGLIYVPRTYRDDSGRPLTVTKTTSARYLSPEYKDVDYKYLKRLGVRKMEHGLFLDHLEKITSRLDEFKARPFEWHSRLAGVLADVWENSSSANYFFGSMSDDSDSESDDDDDDGSDSSSESEDEPIPPSPSPTLSFLSAKDRVKSLPVIPLRDGRWVPGKTPHIFFAGSSSAWELPGGLGFLVVESNAGQDSRRANLYRLLGVKDFNPTEVSKLIVDTHASSTFNPDVVSRADLVSQVKFLYTSGWRNTDGKASFWLATESDTRAKGQVLYIDDEHGPLSATLFFANKRRVFEFIHQDYISAYEQSEQANHSWLAWLKFHMCLSNVPRLARTIKEVNKFDYVFEISPEFNFIIEAFGPLAAINLICTHWVVYRFWIIRVQVQDVTADREDAEGVIDPEVDASYRKLQRKIMTLQVECTDGSKAPLQDTFLPLSDVPTEAEGCVSFISLNDPDHPRWTVLHHFGVGVKQDFNFYCRCLKNFSRSRGSLKKATFFYEQIQARSSEDKASLKKFFGSNDDPRRLLYVPMSRDAEVNPDDGDWFPLRQCLWAGPACMRAHFCLSRVYPSCQRLFVDLLGVSNASMHELMIEAMTFESDDDLTHMRRVFFEIEKCIEKDTTYTHRLETMASGKVWPVTLKATIDDFGQNFDGLLTSQCELFIADTIPLLNSFIGLVPLMAFNIDETSMMKRIIHGLEMDTKRLSRAVESLPKTSGRVEFDRTWTDWFQSRYDFISRLVEPSMVDPDRRKRILASLRNMEVFSVERIVQRYRVKLGAQSIEGRERPGKVVLSPTGDSLKIYLMDQYLANEKNPYELTEQLAQWTGIHEREKGEWLLHMILTEENPDIISSILDDKGVPSKFDDDETDNSWLNSQGRRPVNSGVPHYETKTFCVITAESLLNMFGDGVGDDSYDEGGGARFSREGDFGENPWAGRSGFRLVSGSSAGGNRKRLPPNEPDFDEELEYQGQLFFSKELAKILGDKYNAKTHWTSTLRSKNGLPEYKADATCSFTVKDSDCGASWTKAVASAGYPDAWKWRGRAPTWHIEVKTVGSLSDEFVLSDLHFEMARRHCVAYQVRKNRHIPADVMMLVIVYDTDAETKFNMFPDPWNLYQERLLRLRPTSNFIGRLAVEM